MAVSLTKGQRVSLEKVAPGLSEVFVGLGWDVNATDTGFDFDLDSSVFLLGANEKLISDQHFIFYNNLVSPDQNKSVQHHGDNLTGLGGGDDEVIKIDLKKVPEEVKKIVITVTIHEAQQRRQNFGQVQNAFVRIVNAQNKQEAVRYDLVEDYSIETALIMAELYRKDGQWSLNAVGSGYQGGLQALLDRYS
ncbi:MAG: TerD family protein [Microcystis panniformis Mp_MB_F_20051200_S9]|uniref:TerD family protein n=1 Tax=Microcystis panniformis Mp_MB_F_20051200_S9 TaxID=2486223 RepID=A0A552Q856_9CHRO|nr:MAG: TerD family protein [Microcystis panniformis Mp_GB_SS_20050300_S99]TRV48590.1 MAG: TerD family protein [Microcystis panniformis Mp_MB_F_20080800_S26D]TRV49077.1 MAG: TerD family protein [Microcystis panniformis Mp_GB_SS_20050300_S99D]TRV58738.1 MAG: TerD family protein [Microcystis panniformis Mp_MB_F_20080800_S26]TRV65397.1 MAG: TerD family protein [Microcystis panniformis Mp_MB_F_20051200_S9]TRV69828.1 MAG: TerD family protein [Microcystis panniformis Mp_MB_F_20051200_S9D]TRV75521.1